MKNEHLEITSEVSSEERGKVTPRLPIWMVLLTTAITFGFAYLTYTGGTYAGLMHSGSPGFDAISWGPLSVLFISLVVVNPIGYLITKKKILSPKTMILLFVMLVAAANATALHPALWLLSLMGLSHEAGTNPMVFQPLLEKFNPMVVPLGGWKSIH